MKLKREVDGSCTFRCPGCSELHTLNVDQDCRPWWTWNGSMDKPTFTPSYLEATGHYTRRHKPGDDCWCTYSAKNPEWGAHFKCHICHSFITDGRIQFLNDCTHDLKGQTVDLPEIVND